MPQIMTFMRFHGQDAAYMANCSALTLYRRVCDIDATEATLKQQVTDGELSYHEQELGNPEHEIVVPLGHFL